MAGRTHKLNLKLNQAYCGLGTSEVRRNNEQTTMNWARVTCQHCTRQKMGQYSK